MVTDKSRAGALVTSASQLTLLRDFARLAGPAAVDRKFRLRGQPPELHLERPEVTLTFSGTYDELRALARAGYLVYTQRDRSVAFRANACDVVSPAQTTASLESASPGRQLRGSSRPRALRVGLTTPGPAVILQAAGVVAVLVLAALCIANVVNSAIGGTLAGLGAVLVAILQWRRGAS